MVETRIEYQGDLLCQAVHGPSGATLITDAPVDNNGKGRNFSPTDLVGTALGSCILTIMGILAQRHEIDLKGTTVTVSKHMVAEPVRRIGCLSLDIRVPEELSEENRCRLQNAADMCPVKKSLHPDVQVDIRWHWGK